MILSSGSIQDWPFPSDLWKLHCLACKRLYKTSVCIQFLLTQLQHPQKLKPWDPNESCYFHFEYYFCTSKTVHFLWVIIQIVSKYLKYEQYQIFKNTWGRGKAPCIRTHWISLWRWKIPKRKRKVTCTSPPAALFPQRWCCFSSVTKLLDTFPPSPHSQRCLQDHLRPAERELHRKWNQATQQEHNGWQSERFEIKTGWVVQLQRKWNRRRGRRCIIFHQKSHSLLPQPHLYPICWFTHHYDLTSFHNT